MFNKITKQMKGRRNNLHTVYKLVISLSVIASVFCSVFTIGANAASYVTTGRVYADTLNVRSSYSATSALAGKLYYGQTVTITSSYSGWYQINYNGTSKWVSSSYIKGISTSGVTSTKAAAAVNAADKVIGVPYVYGGVTTSGLDCSGLTLYAYSKAGISLPHSAAKQSVMGAAVSKDSLMPGDLIFFDTTGAHSSVNHVGIYIGGGLFIHASSGTSKTVVMADFRSSYWNGVFMGARRIV